MPCAVHTHGAEMTVIVLLPSILLVCFFAQLKKTLTHTELWEHLCQQASALTFCRMFVLITCFDNHHLPYCCHLFCFLTKNKGLYRKMWRWNGWEDRLWKDLYTSSPPSLIFVNVFLNRLIKNQWDGLCFYTWHFFFFFGRHCQATLAPCSWFVNVNQVDFEWRETAAVHKSFSRHRTPDCALFTVYVTVSEKHRE